MPLQSKSCPSSWDPEKSLVQHGSFDATATSQTGRLPPYIDSSMGGTSRQRCGGGCRGCQGSSVWRGPGFKWGQHSSSSSSVDKDCERIGFRKEEVRRWISRRCFECCRQFYKLEQSTSGLGSEACCSRPCIEKGFEGEAGTHLSIHRSKHARRLQFDIPSSKLRCSNGDGSWMARTPFEGTSVPSNGKVDLHGVWQVSSIA